MKDYCMFFIKMVIDMPTNLVKVPTKLDDFGGCGNVAYFVMCASIVGSNALPYQDHPNARYCFE